ncbi:restriction endonuclease [Candidatus Electrothrix sp.]|uniref:restriction endonuclease n=1 Tax=Candidatus Electrothrix sp. TaxID=2170559 RepID=UPI004055CE13
MTKQNLTLDLLRQEAGQFAATESAHSEPILYGVTDGKAVGTYLEHKFQCHLAEKYKYVCGSSARGIDFPELAVDIKVTSIKQPQSSCPFRYALQKIYGLGYALLVFVYEKFDDNKLKTGRLYIHHAVFVDQSRTADFQTTSGLRKIIENNGNTDDIIAFFAERLLPVDNIQALELAEKVIRNPPELGYLTISNALQWRLQYSRVIQEAGVVPGIAKVY